jgi:hypothetical protein
MHEVDGQRVDAVLDFLAESVGQAGKAANAHPHGKVLPLNVAGADVLPLRAARHIVNGEANALGGAVAALCAFRCWAVMLHQHGVIDL